MRAADRTAQYAAPEPPLKRLGRRPFSLTQHLQTTPLCLSLLVSLPKSPPGVSLEDLRYDAIADGWQVDHIAVFEAMRLLRRWLDVVADPVKRPTPQQRRKNPNEPLSPAKRLYYWTPRPDEEQLVQQLYRTR